jgi:tetratricopeptide (TPR) repeat protein
VRYYRAIANLELGNLEAAHQAADGLGELEDRLMANKPKSARSEDLSRLRRAYLMSRFARATGQPQKGVAGLREAIAASARSPHELAEYRQELAQALYDAGEYQQAVAEGDKLLAAIPAFPKMNLLLAKAHLKEGEPREALENLTVFVDVMQYADDGNPDVTEARDLLKRLVPSG